MDEKLKADLIAEFGTTIYKYKIFSEFAKPIIKGEALYFSHMSQLDDPAEFKFKSNYDDLTVQDRNSLIASIAESHGFRINSRKDKREAIRLSKRGNSPFWSKANAERFLYEKFYGNFRVFSASDTWHNSSLWKTYAPEGFCVGFDTVELFNLIEPQICRVFYVDSPPIHDFRKVLSGNGDWYNAMDQVGSIIMSKNTKWKDQEEIRLVKLYPDEWFKDNSRIREGVLVPLISNPITEINVWQSAPLKEVQEVKRLYGNNTKVKLFTVEEDADGRLKRNSL